MVGLFCLSGGIMRRWVCLIITFVFLIGRIYAATSEVQGTYYEPKREQDTLSIVIELLENSGVLDQARTMEASSLEINESYAVAPMILPELGAAAGVSVSWGAVAILAVCAILCLGVGYASASEEERAIIEQWFKDKWELACEYYCNMSSYSRAFLSYLGKLIDRQATTLAIGMTDAAEAFPEISEDGWSAVRNQYTSVAMKGLPVDHMLMSVGSDYVSVQGYEPKVAIHSLMADLYDRLGRSDNSVTYNPGTEFSKTVKTLFETDTVVVPSSPLNVWGSTPFGVKVISTQRAYNYGWKMAYVELQYHFMGTDNLDYYLKVTYNKKLSSSQAIADSRVQTYGNLSYADNESGYLVDLYKTDGETLLGSWVMHVNNHLTQYASDEIKAQVQKIIAGIAENTGVALDVSQTTNYLYFLDLSPFPESFKLGTNGWVVTHNGYEIKEPALVYPAGIIYPSKTSGGLDTVLFKPTRTTNTPSIMTPEEMRKKYNPEVVVDPVIVPQNPFTITEVIDPTPSPTPSIAPDEEEEIDYEPATELDFKPLKASGNLLATKFPFSLPFDLMALVGLFNVEPLAPVFEIELKNFVPSDFKEYVDVVYQLDLSDYKIVVDILRWFLMLIFISGLIKMTGILIKH